jgi:hypothetical protein
MTLIELMLAVALAAILMLALTRLIDVTFAVWTKTEVRRNLAEQGMGVAERLSRDLRTLHAGAQGDLVFDWVRFDLDGDGIRERAWPRLRLVRQGSPAEVARLTGPAGRPALDSGLIEVAWVALPVSREVDARAEARLLRGERLVDDGGVSCFANGYFDSLNSPPAGALDEISGGLLWWNLTFATQTSVLQDGWNVGRELADVATCWDAWRRDRPDPDLFRWNEMPPGLPAPNGAPLLPRRIRVELEFERPEDRRRRTRLAEALDATSTSVRVQNGTYIPREAGAHLLVDREWMDVLEVVGDIVHVRRGVRASEAAIHAKGDLVHHGAAVVTEVAVQMYQDDWNL